MAHHKRRRAKHQRAGCIQCKPHKDERGKNGLPMKSLQERRLLLGQRADRQEAGLERKGSVRQLRSRRRRKPYTIQWRRKPECWDESWLGTRHREWTPWPTRYATARARDEAILCLNRKADAGGFGLVDYEWRAGPTG